jgi:hypothetical protein
MEAVEFFIVKVNLWFGGKLYEAGECVKLDLADPEVQKLVAKEFIVSTGALVDASEPILSGKETVQDIVEEMVQEDKVQEQVEPEPGKEEDPKIIKKGKRK